MGIGVAISVELLRHRETLELSCRTVRNQRNALVKLYYDCEKSSEMEKDILAIHSYLATLLTVLEAELDRVAALIENRPAPADEPNTTIH